MKKDTVDNPPEYKSSKIAIFKRKQIRKAIHQDEWCFSIIDIIEVLTESSNARRYWSDLKAKLYQTQKIKSYFSCVKARSNMMLFSAFGIRAEGWRDFRYALKNIYFS